MAYRSRGSTGQAPTTSWFGYVPDLFNMLCRLNVSFVPQSMSAANYIEDWPILGTSVTHGAAASAPDGTTDAIKIVESSANEAHAVVAGYYSTTRSGGHKQRLAVFAKAGERTRICLEMCDIEGLSGCRTVYDLAGGQIGVANTAFNASGGATGLWVTADVGITPFGDGWYICWMDAQIGGNGFGGAIGFKIYLDSGSGTGAISTTYAGNGTSGVYFWRSTSLPPGAWSCGIGGVVFDDDFDDPTMANIDLANTRTEGFNWYINGGFPIFYAIKQIPNTAVTHDGVSTITIAGGVNSPQQTVFSTSAWTALGTTGDGSESAAAALAATVNDTVGRYFKPPFIVEMKGGYGNIQTSGVGNICAFWGESRTQLFTPNQHLFTTIDKGMREIDYWEHGINAGFMPNDNMHIVSGGVDCPGCDNNQPGTATGYAKWSAGNVYGGPGGVDFAVVYNGALYNKNAVAVTGDPPDVDTVAWSPYTPVENAALEWLEFDPTDFTCSAIVLPATQYDAGALLLFVNGVLSQQYLHQGGGPGDNRHGSTLNDTRFASRTRQVSDGEEMNIIISSGNTSSHPTYVDRVKVHQ